MRISELLTLPSLVPGRSVPLCRHLQVAVLRHRLRSALRFKVLTELGRRREYPALIPEDLL